MVSPPGFLSHPNFVLPGQIAHSGDFSSVTALINSGAAGNFIGLTLAEKLQVSLQPLWHPLKVQALSRGPIGGASVTLYTEPITLSVSTMHQENISLLITVTTKFPMVLNFLWMQTHDPQIFWKEREIMCLLAPCQVPPCLLHQHRLDHHRKSRTQVHKEISPEYQEFSEVLSKTKASGLLLHHANN